MPPILPPPKILSPEWAEYFLYIWKKYDISEAQWRSAYKIQRGCCAICGKSRDKLVTDHDHKTGQFRGLLCIFCNGLLGKVEKFGNRIFEYLEQAGSKAIL